MDTPAIKQRPVPVSGMDDAMQAVLRGPLQLEVAVYRMPEHSGLVLALEQEGFRLPVVMDGYSRMEQARHSS